MKPITDPAIIHHLFDTIKNNLPYDSFQPILDQATDCLEFFNVEAGEYLFNKNDLDDTLYYLIDGTVEIRHQREKNYSKIEEISGGRFIGEIDFIDEMPRNDTVIATTPLTILKVTIAIKRKYPELTRKLINDLMLTYGLRIRRVHNKYVEELHQKLDALQQKATTGKLLFFIVFVLSVALIINKVIDKYVTVNIFSTFFVWLYILGLFLPVFSMFLPKQVLINKIFRQNTFASFRNAIALSFIGIISIIALSSFSHHTSFKTTFLNTLINFDSLLLLTYYFLSLFQEIVRCTMQDLLETLFTQHQKLWSALSTSYVFAILHIFYGLEPVILMFLAGLLISTFYIYQRNILATSIFHWLNGYTVFASGIIGPT